MTDDETDDVDPAEGRYDEEANVCTGCGQVIDSGSWCHSCTYGR
jgi:hypothetical protein